MILRVIAYNNVGKNNLKAFIIKLEHMQCSMRFCKLAAMESIWCSAAYVMNIK